MEFVWILIGIVVGWIITSIIFVLGHPKAGVLKIDHSNPEKDTYRFEIDDLDSLSKRKYITLSIDNHADLSQK